MAVKTFMECGLVMAFHHDGGAPYALLWRQLHIMCALDPS